MRHGRRRDHRHRHDLRVRHDLRDRRVRLRVRRRHGHCLVLHLRVGRLRVRRRGHDPKLVVPRSLVRRVVLVPLAQRVPAGSRLPRSRRQGDRHRDCVRVHHDGGVDACGLRRLVRRHLACHSTTLRRRHRSRQCPRWSQRQDPRRLRAMARRHHRLMKVRCPVRRSLRSILLRAELHHRDARRADGVDACDARRPRCHLRQSRTGRAIRRCSRSPIRQPNPILAPTQVLVDQTAVCRRPCGSDRLARP